MLEHATYLKIVALRLQHDAVQTFSATLVRTNITKIIDLLEVTFGVDLSKDDEDDIEVESVSEEEEEHLPQTGMTSHAAAQSVDSAKYSTPAQSPSITHKQPAPKIKGQKQCKEEGPEVEWVLKVKPLNRVEVYYAEKGISYLKTGVPKKFISQGIKQGSKGVYECHYEFAPECQYSVENCGMVAIHIHCAGTILKPIIQEFSEMFIMGLP